MMPMQQARLAEKKVVTVGAGPHRHVGYASWTDQVWVLNSDENSITVLGGSTGDEAGTIELGAAPRHVILHEPSGCGYVPLDSGALAVIDAAELRVVSTVSLPGGGGESCLLPMLESDRLYVLNEAVASVAVVDSRKQEVAGSIPVGRGACWGQPHEKSCGKLYVAGAGSDDVTVIDQPSEKVITTVRVGRRPARAAIFREQGLVYTADLDSNTVSAISIAEDRLVATVGVGTRPFRLVGMQKKTGRPDLWVLNLGSADGEGVISVVDASTNKLRDSLGIMPSPSNWLLAGPIAHVVSSQGRQMMVIDARSHDILYTVPLTEAPDPSSLSNMVFSGAGNLFLANAGDTVTVLAPEGQAS
jgi:YVTN family beta-propeller protein